MNSNQVCFALGTALSPPKQRGSRYDIPGLTLEENVNCISVDDSRAALMEENAFKSPRGNKLVSKGKHRAARIHLCLRDELLSRV